MGLLWWEREGKSTEKHEQPQKHRRGVFSNENNRLGEFAQCMGRGRCRGMRLDCPLHCGGPCFYDCHSATICARLVISSFSS
jgi:hypothetical protein